MQIARSRKGKGGGHSITVEKRKDKRRIRSIKGGKKGGGEKRRIPCLYTPPSPKKKGKKTAQNKTPILHQDEKKIIHAFKEGGKKKVGKD